ncbi:serine--tRNA ligase [Magnetospirillum molischianum]|uniref:Serine--tRNA ligase n=1 Tax=Magnetospirillum molischianum DSM 120 TaxID=1150626 RepID=H8FRS5_MAGML|nr:serine--tRNA ligase [Magnetospirillum molischianum]CCG41063.1 Seryl-tRNA synthetase (Serine--tRNA ligase) [Magnetospirillum molischianum DSM 120]
MHDLKSIRDNPEAFDAGLARRGLPPQSAAILELDARRRSAQTTVQDLQARRNEASKQIGQIKRQGGDCDALMAEVAALKERIPAIEDEERELGAEIETALASLPNLPDDSIPDGPDESANVEIRRWGTPRAFDFTPLDHDVLGEKLGMDFDGAAKLSGARFVVLKGSLARLQRAIGQFMIDIQTTEHGYTEIDPPLMIKDAAAFGTGQLPKFSEDLFKTNTGHWLIPTAEVPLTNLVADSILDEKDLPLRMTALTPCFRSEAGSAGKDTRGMIRQHQFHKVEMVAVVHPDRSDEEHERMTKCAETVLQRLGLPYRVVVLCAGDTGFSSRKTYDIEVWLPGQQRYREISSCSNCGEFQARRMKARFRPEGEKGTRPVHTLNGSGLAVGRTLIAVLENYQQADGSITVPEALRPYLGGLEQIG